MLTWPLAKALESKGHSISYISVVEPPEKHPNISVFIQETTKRKLYSLFELSLSFSSRSSMPFMSLYLIFPALQGIVSQALFSSEEFQEWISSDPEVDLIIVDSFVEFGLRLANRFRSKLVIFATSTFMAELLENSGVPEEVMSTADHPFRLQDASSFYSRFKYEVSRLVNSLILPIGRYWVSWNYKQYVDPEYSSSSLKEQLKNVSLVMHNGFEFEGYQKSLPPNFVGVGGIHIKETNSPLEKVSSFLFKLNSCNNKLNSSYCYYQILKFRA